MAKSVISGLISAVPGCQKLRQVILYALSSNKFSESLARFQSHHLPARRDPSSHDLPDICFTRFKNLQRSLSQMLCSLFLRTALLGNAEEVSIDASLAGALIDKQMSVGGAQDTCQIGLSYRVDRVGQLSLFEAASSPALATASRHWKARLADELCRDATHRHDTVVRIVGEVCRDLEARCEVTEQPLVEERARSTHLRRRLETSEKKLAEVEIQQQERALILTGMETEKNSLVAQVQVAEQRLRDLSGELDKVHQKFDRAKQEIKHAAEANQETAKQRELEQLAILTAKDEIIEDQNMKLRSVEADAQSLNEQIEDLRSQSSDSQKIIDRLQTMLDERTTDVAELKASAVSNGEEIGRLRKVESKMESDNRTLRSEVCCRQARHTFKRDILTNISFKRQRSSWRPPCCSIMIDTRSWRRRKLGYNRTMMITYQRKIMRYATQIWVSRIDGWCPKSAYGVLCSSVTSDMADCNQISRKQLRQDREVQALQNELAQASNAAASYARKQSSTISDLQKRVGFLSVRSF